MLRDERLQGGALEELELDNNPFGEAGALALMRTKLPPLRKLSLSEVDLDQGMRDQLVEHFGTIVEV